MPLKLTQQKLFFVYLRQLSAFLVEICLFRFHIRIDGLVLSVMILPGFCLATLLLQLYTGEI